MLDRALI